jgi:hypothetical protein
VCRLKAVFHSIGRFVIGSVNALISSLELTPPPLPHLNPSLLFFFFLGDNVNKVYDQTVILQVGSDREA